MRTTTIWASSTPILKPSSDIINESPGLMRALRKFDIPIPCIKPKVIAKK